MIITIDVPAEIADQISDEASCQGKDMTEVMRGLVEQGIKRRSVRPYSSAAFIAAVDSFDAGDAEEQRRTLEHLKIALDRNRFGERRIFGEGINPMPPLDETC